MPELARNFSFGVPSIGVRPRIILPPSTPAPVAGTPTDLPGARTPSPAPTKVLGSNPAPIVSPWGLGARGAGKQRAPITTPTEIIGRGQGGRLQPRYGAFGPTFGRGLQLRMFPGDILRNRQAQREAGYIQNAIDRGIQSGTATVLSNLGDSVGGAELASIGTPLSGDEETGGSSPLSFLSSPLILAGVVGIAIFLFMRKGRK